ncbi:MAG: hypothetical protein WC841_00050 [Candidatus Shapirobacteria bacterium]|jgi:hypothetical protein
MIGNPKWFSIRKYGGWGVTPNCLQGWLYILAVAAPIFLLQIVPVSESLKTGITFTWALIFSVDLIDIMIRMKKDERETIHEAKAERNAMWFMIGALTIGIAYQTAMGIIKQTNEIDPVIMIALGGAMIVKTITHIYLRNK